MRRDSAAPAVPFSRVQIGSRPSFFDLSPENDELLDALGILPPDRAERLLAASGHDERPAEWSADLVKRRIREATGHIESGSPDKKT